MIKRKRFSEVRGAGHSKSERLGIQTKSSGSVQATCLLRRRGPIPARRKELFRNRREKTLLTLMHEAGGMGCQKGDIFLGKQDRHERMLEKGMSTRTGKVNQFGFGGVAGLLD